MSKKNILDKLGAGLDKLLDQRICIGVTGLSQSGKSTFITSLINQLENHNKAHLAGFSPVTSERLLGVKMHPLNDASLLQFPYAESYARLTEPNPQWPVSTTAASGCLLELKLKSAKGLNPLKRKRFSLYVEIRDYPGEWLLDLPLRDMSFARWCSQCNAQYPLAPRALWLGDLLTELRAIDPLAECDEALLEMLHQHFVAFLQRCKKEPNHLSMIQPGRFLLPEVGQAANAYCFVPLLNAAMYSEEQLATANKNSFFKVCEARYAAYVKQLVEPFYKHFFSRIDRQIVLVDLVNALNGGPEYLTDMRQALSNIMDSFSYGEQNRLLQLINPKIDKLVFAATKIDQVLAEDHDAVRQLLAVVVKQAYSSAAHDGVEPICEAIAAVRASKEVNHQGERGIAGMDKNGQAIGYIHPTIPLRFPQGEEWQAFAQWKIPDLNPPRGLSHENADVLPHIRLDSVLNHLLGDKCQ